MANKRPAGIFVLGMHRSGTSAAVLSLESLGLKLCTDADRLREGQGNSNPDHGESLSVIAENDALLGLSNGTWAHPRLNPDWLDAGAVTARQARAKSMFNAAHPETPWACKDPRLCLTLPFWERALSARHPILLVIRHPIEIVQSLQQRESPQGPHHPASYYLAVWERYMRSAIINSAHHPVYILNYHDLVSDWDGSSAALSNWLSQHGLPAVAPANNPVKSNLYRARTSASLAGLTPDQRRLHQLLTNLAGPHRDMRLPKLGRETPRTAALFGPGPDLATAGYLALPATKTLRRRLVQINPLVTKHYAVIGLAVTSLLAAASIVLMQLTRFGDTTGANNWITRQLLRVQLPSFQGLLNLASTVSAKDYLDWLAIAATAALLVIRKRSAAAILLLGLLAESLITDVLRGPAHDPATFFTAKTFRAAVLLGLLAYLAFRLIESRLWRSVIAGFCLLMVALIALSRVYLRFHYPSAVLSSLMLGAAVAVMLIAVFESIQKSPHRVPPKRHAMSTTLAPTIPLDDAS